MPPREKKPYQLPQKALDRIEELVALAPPLTEGQKRIIRQALAPRPPLPAPAPASRETHAA